MKILEKDGARFLDDSKGRLSLSFSSWQQWKFGSIISVLSSASVCEFSMDVWRVVARVCVCLQ